ncbi:hypothetical protein GCK72_018769 [Caenorhabditis remanei]|uniref:Serine/threonine specific protein phosphatases domain-containing protein n=2 Tax=Caenorhabditis remanei TaxID=31234 RepID=E3LZK2_CAERE|nr:hypothetical protein GCK72_018769 [Caenorhabditis remanei]EFO87694.1 hypothetical protein CRE_05491 [Caenorhabditis remanei]KAF1752215.1 hypothetical protein GCK72_018769 [Caenorhabditis remanei]
MSETRPDGGNKRNFYERIIQDHLQRGPIEHDYSFGFLSELMEDALDMIDGECRVEYLSPPVNICGDIRSRYGDLLDIFRNCGWPFDQKYAFLGNFIDGGKFSMETLVLLICCKICYPQNFVILRGNFEHELVKTERKFIGELRVRYPDSQKFQALNTSMKSYLKRLPLVAILNRKIVCVNGLISSNIKQDSNAVLVKNGNSFENHNTRLEILFPESDYPSVVTPMAIEEESKTLKELLKSMDMSMIINSNNVIKQGYQFNFGHQLLTITTGTKLAKAFNNRGIVMMMDRHNKVNFKTIQGLDGEESLDLNDSALRV